MKTWFVSCLIVYSFFIGTIPVQAKTVESKATDVTTTFVRPILSNKLPGITNIPGTDKVTDKFITTTKNRKPDKQLPETNEKIHLIYSVLGSICIGYVTYTCLYIKKGSE